MKKLVLVAALAVGASGCEPEIAQDPAPAQTVVQFEPSASPPIVPSPNDIAIDPDTGKVNAPIDPNSSPAQQEFTRDYINSLNGFPQTAVASASVSAPLVPTSVTAATVRVLPLNGPAAAVYSPTVTAGKITPTISYDTTTNRILVTPNGTWPKGSQWAVVVVGGANGVQSADGTPVVESSTFTLLKSEVPLANCPAKADGSVDYKSPDCTLGTNLIPSNVTESPEARFRDQLASAVRLERIRVGYAKVFAALAALPPQATVAKENVVLLWTWTTVAQPEPTFDPAGTTPLGRILPFPTNLALTQNADGGTQVNLPTAGATGAQLDLLRGLNSLDGFSTTAHIVTENTDAVPALSDGLFIANPDGGVVANGALIAQASSKAELKTTPSVYACVNCRSSLLADGGVQPLQQLQIVPNVPFDERSTYVAALSTDAPAVIKLLDDSVKTTTVMAPAAWALLRMKNPLHDSNNKSLIAGVPDVNAVALEPIRKSLQPALDAVEATVPRSKMAMGTVFTTQSTVSVLKALQGLPNALPAATAGAFSLEKVDPADYAARGIPAALIPSLTASVDVYFGSAFFPIAINTATGTLNATSPAVQRAPFILTVPKTAVPAGGFPVTQFGHGLTGNRQNVYGIATALAQAGRAAISFDTIFHGERSLCGGSAGAIAGACFTGTCDTTLESPTFGRCVNTNVAARLTCAPFTAAGDRACAIAREGVCLPVNPANPAEGGVCEGGDFRRAGDPSAANPGASLAGQDPRFSVPLVNGNILNLTNLFATRDNFRHQVVDLSQMVRVLKAPGATGFNARLTAANGGTAVAVDATKIDYVGQSLGGILGTLYTSVSPDVQKAVLNVPGADPAGILLTSPGFRPQRDAFVANLRDNANINEGTPAFDNFINFARWILDPADPQNAAAYLRNGGTKPAGRDVLVQYITQDQTIPNPQTDKLIAAANRPAGSGADNQCKVSRWNPRVVDTSTQLDAPTPGLALADRHSFLLTFRGATTDPTKTFTAAAQAQAVGFLATGNVSTIPPAATQP